MVVSGRPPAKLGFGQMATALAKVRSGLSCNANMKLSRVFASINELEASQRFS
jgi:hypothetical protein